MWAQQAEAYIRPALESLEEIQRTGDIFFPRNWTDAALTWHQTRSAADVVRKFLADRQDYPLSAASSCNVRTTGFARQRFWDHDLL